ncbi:unnamed protein product, partial [Ectocarpus fasciculatus]
RRHRAGPPLQDPHLPRQGGWLRRIRTAQVELRRVLHRPGARRRLRGDHLPPGHLPRPLPRRRQHHGALRLLRAQRHPAPQQHPKGVRRYHGEGEGPGAVVRYRAGVHPVR